jgi:phosphatidylinositol 4-kinase
MSRSDFSFLGIPLYIQYWYPASFWPERKFPDDDKVSLWLNQPVTVKNWREHVRLSWEISPILAVYLPLR